MRQRFYFQTVAKVCRDRGARFECDELCRVYRATADPGRIWKEAELHEFVIPWVDDRWKQDALQVALDGILADRTVPCIEVNPEECDWCGRY